MTPKVDIIEAGHGPPVLLIHSSVAGAAQWRRLMEELGPRRRTIAPNLFGYGATPAWTGPAPQTVGDQAALVLAALPRGDAPVSLVGHSFGGVVAMEAARRLAGRARRLVLVEPNPFPLLRMHGHRRAYDEAVALGDRIRRAAAREEWRAAAATFADYWTGPGSWAAMPEARRDRFAAALRPNLHEWDAVLGETTTLAEWRAALPARTTVIAADDTVRTIRRIVALMREACPGWRIEAIPEGGHMAVLSRPETVNPLIRAALGA